MSKNAPRMLWRKKGGGGGGGGQGMDTAGVNT